MKFKFVPMNDNYAKTMINEWKYENEYSIYDYCNEAEDLLEKKNWGFSKFAVLNEKEILVGELTINFFREVEEDSDDDGYADIDTVKDNPDINYEMWVGFGLEPNLTGIGLGKEFVSACVNFAVEHHQYKGDYVRLGVAEFNKRAIKTYEKSGFKVFSEYDGEIAGEIVKVLWMRKSQS